MVFNWLSPFCKITMFSFKDFSLFSGLAIFFIYFWSLANSFASYCVTYLARFANYTNYDATAVKGVIFFNEFYRHRYIYFTD